MWHDENIYPYDVSEPMRTSTVLSIAGVAVLLILFGSFIASSGNDDGDGSFIILHSNDTHCYLGEDGNLGFSTLKSLKEQKISEGNTVFLIDAGDILQGNVYGTVTEGEASVEVMNEVGYDLGVPGNHDFDYTFPVMMEKFSELNYPIICSNLVYTSTGHSIFPEYKILERDGIRLGCFGILTPDTVTTTREGNMGDSTVTDPVAAAKRMVSLLEGEDVDYIVCVGHVGVIRSYTITSDQICSQVPGIDIFIDGHSHTEMEDGKVCDGSIELIPSDTVIASTGSYCKTFGIITVDPDKGIDAKLYRGEAMSDKTIDETVTDIHETVDEKLGEVVGSTTIYLDGERGHVRCGETNLGDLLTDAIRTYAGTDVAIVNGGGIRSSIAEGDITLEDLYNVLPFQNDLVTLTVTGENIYNIMEYSYSHAGEEFGGFMHISGMALKYDASKEAGSRIVSVTIGGKDLDRSASYTLATFDFITTGGDGMTELLNIPKQVVGSDIDSFKEYIEKLDSVTESSIEGGRQVSV